MIHPLNAEFVRLLALAGWSQAECARRLHLDPGTISQYVSHRTRPSPTVLGFFKALVGDPTPIPGVENSALPGIESKRALEGWEEELLSGLRALEPEKRKRIVRYLQGLLDEIPKAPATGALLPSVMEKILSESPRLPDPLKKIPSSATGYKESLPREESKKRKAVKKSAPDAD
jgi:transcriptional regulator with XRE-family HTH domain